MLAVAVCILVAIDVVFMILTLSVPQLRVGAVLVPDVMNPISETGVSKEHTIGAFHSGCNKHHHLNIVHFLTVK